MLERVKLALRLTTTAFDAEINDLIAACAADLAIAGVHAPVDDPLYIRAVILYSKAGFGSNADSEKYAKSYESLKIYLALDGDYNGRATATD